MFRYDGELLSISWLIRSDKLRVGSLFTTFFASIFFFVI